MVRLERLEGRSGESGIAGGHMAVIWHGHLALRVPLWRRRRAVSKSLHTLEQRTRPPTELSLSLSAVHAR
jgi:hypothetical protein